MKQVTPTSMPVDRRIAMRDRIERAMAKIIAVQFQGGDSVDTLAERFDLNRLDVEELLRSRVECRI